MTTPTARGPVAQLSFHDGRKNAIGILLVHDLFFESVASIAETRERSVENALSAATSPAGPVVL